MDPVTRDVVWNAALELAATRPDFRAHDVATSIDHDASDRTIRRTLRSMEDLGWLERDAPGSHYWKAGPRAREYFDMERGNG